MIPPRCSSLFLVLSVGACPCACASASDSVADESPGQDHVVAADTKALAAVNVDYGTIEFYETTSMDGNVSYGVTETATAFAADTPFDATMSEKPHTLLELFLAVAPDQEPPAELVALHQTETERLNRETDAIQPAIFDKNAPVQKAAQACNSMVYASPGSCYEWNHKLKLATTGAEWLPVGDDEQDFSHFTGSNVTLGVCNPTQASTQATVAYNQDPEDPTWHLHRSAAVIPAYTAWRDWNFSVADWTEHCSEASGCTDSLRPARYAVSHEPGAKVTLMTAESHHVGC